MAHNSETPGFQHKKTRFGLQLTTNAKKLRLAEKILAEICHRLMFEGWGGGGTPKCIAQGGQRPQNCVDGCLKSLSEREICRKGDSVWSYLMREWAGEGGGGGGRNKAAKS